MGGGVALGFLTDKLIGLLEPEELESAGAVIEKEAWVRVVPKAGWTSRLDEELYSGGPEGKRVQGPGEINVEEEWMGGNGAFPGPLPGPGVSVGQAYYLLIFKTEGDYYWSAGGPAALLEGSHAGSWYGDYTEEYEEKGCEPWSWEAPAFIAGWPPKLTAAHLVTGGSSYHAHCTPYYEYANERGEWVRVNKPEKAYSGTQAYYWRDPKQFEFGFPRPEGTCGGECPEIPLPSLPPHSKELGSNAEEAFGSTSLGPELKKWVESNPPPGEEPRVYPPAVKEVAGALATNNPESEKGKTELERVSEDCLKEAARANRNGRVECTTLPIFMPGSDVLQPATNDAEAIKETPEWFRLNNETIAEKESKGEYPGWYSEAECRNEKSVERNECDEYPFFASEQGGKPKSELFPTPRLEWVSGTQNKGEGGKYSGFKSKCALATHEQFLVVPVLSSPTDSLCNR